MIFTLINASFHFPRVEVRYINLFTGVTIIDNTLTWRDQLEKTHKSLSSQYRVLTKMRNLLPKLLEAFYFRTVIPQITYCISVWGNCSVAKLYEIENLHIKVGRIVHRVPQNILES